MTHADRPRGPLAAIVPMLALAALCLAPGRAAAQDLSWASTLDAAGDRIYLAFIEPAVRFGREGDLQPILSLGGYIARVEGDDSFGFAPAAALRYGGYWGSIQGKIGWGRSSSAVVGAGTPTMMMVRVGAPAGLKMRPAHAAALASAVADGNDGGALNTSLQTEVGSDVWGVQGIASYSWGPHVLWTRGRVSRVVSMAASGGSVALGAEVVWQAQTDDDDPFQDNEYRASYLGPVIRVARAGGAAWILSGGLKRFRPLDDRTWYAKLELTLNP